MELLEEVTSAADRTLSLAADSMKSPRCHLVFEKLGLVPGLEQTALAPTRRELAPASGLTKSAAALSDLESDCVADGSLDDDENVHRLPARQPLRYQHCQTRGACLQNGCAVAAEIDVVVVPPRREPRPDDRGLGVRLPAVAHDAVDDRGYGVSSRDL